MSSIFKREAVNMRLGFVPFKPEDLIRQPNNFGCGCAALATVCKILNKPEFSYDALAHILNPSPKGGTEQDDILKFSQSHFPGVSGGRDTYNGGLAVLSMIHYEVRPQGTGHYVTALGVERFENLQESPHYPKGEVNLPAEYADKRRMLIQQYAPKTDLYIKYYCPWMHEVYLKPFSEVIWSNSLNDYIHWTCNFPLPLEE